MSRHLARSSATPIEIVTKNTLSKKKLVRKILIYQQKCHRIVIYTSRQTYAKQIKCRVSILHHALR
jgi:hypothetical protein